MQYDLNKLGNDEKIKLTWHGTPTRVLIDDESGKRDIATGETFEVRVSQAKRLIGLDRNFTLEGDKPVAKPTATVAPTVTNADGSDSKLTIEKVKKLEKKADVVAALKELGVPFNDTLSKAELKTLLLEAMQEQAASATDKNPNSEIHENLPGEPVAGADFSEAKDHKEEVKIKEDALSDAEKKQAADDKAREATEAAAKEGKKNGK